MAQPIDPLGPALAAALAPLQAQLNGQQTLIGQLSQQVNIIQTQLAVLFPAGLAAAAAQSQRLREAARLSNHHELSGVPYTPVPRADGTLPPSWPPEGLTREAIVQGAIAAVDALLGDYGLPRGAEAGLPAARRVALALALGTILV